MQTSRRVQRAVLTKLTWQMLGGLGRNATLALEPHLLGGGENGGVVEVLTGLGGARRPREPTAVHRAAERALPGRSWRVERSLPLGRHKLLPAGGRRCWVVTGDRLEGSEDCILSVLIVQIDQYQVGVVRGVAPNVREHLFGS